MTNIVKPSRSSQDIVLFGRQQDVKLALLQAVATHRTVWNKDVGQIVGLPVADAQRPKAQDRILKILWKSKEKPPWKVNGKNPKSIDYTIPNCKRNLTWDQLKRAAPIFTWGEYRATAIMSSGRQMAVYGNTKDEAIRVIRSLATLSTDTIIKLRTSDDVIIPEEFQKLPVMMYPCYATLLSEPTDKQGMPRTGKRAYKKQRRRLDLYRKPQDLSPLG